MKALTYKKVKEYLGVEERPRKGRKRRRQTKETKQARKITLRVILFGVIFLGIVLVVGVIGVGVMVIKYSHELPAPGKPFATNNLAQTTQIYDRNGVLLATLNNGNVNRELVNLTDIDGTMKWATISAEDINFYSEPGFDILGIARAGLSDLLHRGSGLQGGSTITQQLVKNADLTDTQTFQRKIEEFILTLEVERAYSKNQILQAYLNEIPYGGVVYGIKVAAQNYFGVEPSQLDLAQSAFLAGLPQAPSYYSPIYGVDPVLSDGNLASTDRAYYVLDQMLKHSDQTGVTAAEVAAAKKEIPTFNFTHTFSSQKAPHFIDYVTNELENMYGTTKVQEGGLKVYTTLNYNIQQVAQSEVDTMFNKMDTQYHFANKAYEPDAGMVSIDPKTGEILAMVGAPTNTTDINIVTDPTGVQPGSSIKPFLYASAFSNLGMAPTTMMADVPISIPSYKGYTYTTPYAPVNFAGDGFAGPTSIDHSLSYSLNVPAVETLYSLTVTKFVSDLQSWGYTGLANGASQASNLSYAIGGENVVWLDHVNAYAMLANEGTQYPETSILKVEDSNSNVIYQYDPSTAGKQVLDPAYAYMVDWMLEHYKYLLQDGERHDPTLFTQGYSLAGKTGTNNTNTGDQNASSLSFVGYTPDLVSGFWYGNLSQGKPLNTSSVVGLPEGEYLIQYWGDYMLKVLPKFPKDSFARPSDVVVKQVCSDTGFLYQAGNTCSPTTGYFQQDHVPAVDTAHVSVQVCQSDNTKLATPAMVTAGQAVAKTIIEYKTFDPFFQSMLNTYLKSSDIVPTQYCTTSSGVSLEINTPKDQSAFNAGDQVNIDSSVVIVNSSNTVNNVDVYFNNAKVGSLTQSQTTTTDYSGSFNIPSGTPVGTYPLTLKAFDNQGNEQDESVNLVIGQTAANTTPTTSNVTTSMTMTTPQDGSVVQIAPHKTQLGLQIQNNIDPTTIKSAYFTVTDNGVTQTIQANGSGGSWTGQYIFPLPNQGYTIQGCITLTNSQTPACSSSVTVSS